MAHDSGLSDETMAGGTPDDEPTHAERIETAARRAVETWATWSDAEGWDNPEYDDFVTDMKRLRDLLAGDEEAHS